MLLSFLGGKLEIVADVPGHPGSGRLLSKLLPEHLATVREDREMQLGYNGALNGIESLLLALVCEGLIKKVDKRIDSALQTALDAVENEYGG